MRHVENTTVAIQAITFWSRFLVRIWDIARGWFAFAVCNGTFPGDLAYKLVITFTVDASADGVGNLALSLLTGPTRETCMSMSIMFFRR